MNKRNILLAGILLAGAGGLYALFGGGGSGPAGTGGVPAVSMEFSDTELHETRDGETVWTIRVGHAAMDADKNTIRLTDVDGYFKNESLELHLTAKSGIAKRKEKTLYLEGDVVGRTSDGAVLQAQNLSYDGMKEILSTDQFFTVEKDGRILSADSFTADRILQEIEARGHARLEEKGDVQ